MPDNRNLTTLMHKLFFYQNRENKTGSLLLGSNVGFIVESFSLAI